MTDQQVIAKADKILHSDIFITVDAKMGIGRKVPHADLELLQEQIDKLYCLIHSHTKKSSCYKTHAAWRKLSAKY